MEFYTPYLAAWMKLLFPDLKAQGRFNESFTYNQLYMYVIQAVGATFCLGGFFLLLNFRKLGGIICILAVGFMIATQDNPLLLEHLKPKPKIMKINLGDLARHISLIGALIYMMVVEPVSDIDLEKVAKEERKKAKAERRAVREAVEAELAKELAKDPANKKDD